MSLPAWDLDAPAESPRPDAGPRTGLVLVLAIGLAGLALGALAGSVLSPAAAPRSPTTATLNIRDLYLDTSLPAPTSNPGSDAGIGPRPQLGAAVVVFRLQVDNPGPKMIRVTGLDLDGVTRKVDRLPLNLRVAAHGSAGTDVTLRPDCSTGREPDGVRAWLRLTTANGSDPVRVRIAPSRALSRFGGLCSQLDTELPNGWRTPLQANSTRTIGADLEITINDLSAARLSGTRIDGLLLPTVYLGDQLVSSSAELQPGQATRLRLRGPSPCVQFAGNAPVPSTLRLLTEGEGGLQQRLVVVGPDLTRWLRLDCPADDS